ncbi:MAG: hypothetical protein Q9171_005668 [Xanthocarpia ochracea]
MGGVRARDMRHEKKSSVAGSMSSSCIMLTRGGIATLQTHVERIAGTRSSSEANMRQKPGIIYDLHAYSTLMVHKHCFHPKTNA